jgi:hypothetical protein
MRDLVGGLGGWGCPACCACARLRLGNGASGAPSKRSTSHWDDHASAKIRASAGCESGIVLRHLPVGITVIEVTLLKASCEQVSVVSLLLCFHVVVVGGGSAQHIGACVRVRLGKGASGAAWAANRRKQSLRWPCSRQVKSVCGL